MKVFILIVSVFFFLAFAFLDPSHEFLKKQIRRISAKKLDDPNPRELDYPFFRLAGTASVREPWRRFSRAASQIADRDDFIRQTAPGLFDHFILQERILRLLFGASFFVLTLDAFVLVLKLSGLWK